MTTKALSTVRAPGLRACSLVLSLVAVLTTTPAASLAQTPAPGLKLRHIAEHPHDHVGKVFTVTVWLSTSQQWMKRARWGDYYLALTDVEGNKYPGDTGYDPAWELHSLRFVLPKDHGNALISQLDPQRLYRYTVSFTIRPYKDALDTRRFMGRYLAWISQVTPAGGNTR